MVEDNDIKDDDIDEQEEQNKEKKEAKKKSKIGKGLQKTFSQIEKPLIVILALIVISPLIAYFLTSRKLDKINKEKKMHVKDDVFSFPEEKKNAPQSIIRFFSTGSRKKEFKIKLDDLSTIITAEIFLAYNQNNRELTEEIDKRKYEIYDRINLIISSKTYYDLNTASARDNHIKKELINEINSFLETGKITDIYFGQFYVSRMHKER